MPQGLSGGIVEYFSPGDRITMTASGSVSGGDVVSLAASRKVAVATASTRPVGVALHDAADGAVVTVAMEGVWPLVATTTVTAGDIVVTTASGEVVAAGTTTTSYLMVGIAMSNINAGATGPVKLRL